MSTNSSESVTSNKCLVLWCCCPDIDAVFRDLLLIIILGYRLLGCVQNLEKLFHLLLSILHFIIRYIQNFYLVALLEICLNVTNASLKQCRLGTWIHLKRVNCTSYSN
jgi:hypothetical protein